jgi:hypothetical protein
VAFWKAQHLPGLRLTANGTQNDKAEAGSIPVLTTKLNKNDTGRNKILGRQMVETKTISTKRYGN